jgi:uncharacterized membrane protein YheB (UPF0754 family)
MPHHRHQVENIRDRFKRKYGIFGVTMKVSDYMIRYFHSHSVINDKEKSDLLSFTEDNRTYKLLNYLMINESDVVFKLLVRILIQTGQHDLAKLVDGDLYIEYTL